MGAFKDLFKSKDSKQQTKQPSQLPQPLWALATEPTPRPIRPSGPRSPSKRSEVSSLHSASSRSDVDAAAARALAGRQAGEKAREGLLHKRRRRSESLKGLSQGMERVQLESSAQSGGRRPLPATPTHVRPATHQRTHSTPAAILTRQDMHGPSPTRPRPFHSQSHQPISPPKGRPPSHLSSSPTRPSLYPQALPVPPRPPLPPVPRGPNPIRQIAPSAPPSAPQSRNVSGSSSCFSPMFPGSFPRDPGVGVGLRMTEPWDSPAGGASPSAQSVSTLPYMSQNSPAQSYQPSPLYQQQSQQSSYHHSPSCNPAYVPAPPPPFHSRPPPRPISTSASAPVLTVSSTMLNKAKRKPVVPIIDLTLDSNDRIPATPPRTPPSGVKNQCHGTTGAGKRCIRTVGGGGTPGLSPAKGRAGGASNLEAMLEADGEGEGVVRFCHQHAKQAMAERGCFVTSREGRGKWVEFDDWILPDLPIQTKILLRHEMAMPVSAKDEDGYIYVHEMVERTPSRSSPSINPTTFLKLGRSVRPVNRLAQWRSQCPSREPIVRAIFPLPSFPNSSSFSVGGVGMSGALRVAQQGLPHHHRWERLVLIEVAGRAEVELGSQGEDGERKACADCGRKHLELFEVPVGAFDEWVAEVVERWGRWVGDVLG